MKLFTSKYPKLINRMILLFSTFCFGLIGFLIWVQISPPVLTPCEVAKNPKQYQGQTIRLAAFVQTHYGFFYFQDNSCDFKSFDAAINLPEDYQPQSEQIRYFLSQTNEKYLSAQTFITGEVDTTILFQDYSPVFVIKATKIELTSKTIETEEFNENSF